MLKGLGSPEPSPQRHPALEHPPGTRAATSPPPRMSLPEKCTCRARLQPPSPAGNAASPPGAALGCVLAPGTHPSNSSRPWEEQSQPPAEQNGAPGAGPRGHSASPGDAGAGSGMRLGFPPGKANFSFPKELARGGAQHDALQEGNCPSTQQFRPFLVLESPFGVSSASNSSLGK